MNNHIKNILLFLSCILMVPSTYAQKKKNYTDTAQGVSFDMVFVKGSTFKMGDKKGDLLLDNGINPSVPVHEVTIDGFFVGKFEVTQALWEAVMGENPSEMKMGNHPVEMVSWNDCQEFLKKLNTLTGKDYRLLTESEWEYVTRGGKKGVKMDVSSQNIEQRAWMTSNTENNQHQEVGTKAANELGIYDLQGNVWEWVNDWYSETSYKQAMQSNPQGIQNGTDKVYRGGSFMSEVLFCRPAYRNFDKPDVKMNFLGLRIARSL
ncbi:formylglycine-generating enzyme family protein [Flammeovirga aprica]|uniref:Formylglycine-generating enzyme family protein n=1 Tax=Flammeovirga aprica JL-4 TaxID=694437 RepID=A0A7X9RVD7_9BACT|nr:SUMF1/EgtB/PvdO family nonheme iron enzyme [Flammeovirga aprica]NME69425.1 formylglycine-generating enzyme family protein [Flammeovirga aprica JL-4]